jgi:muramoyltetrapeptide carboxypeptidase
MQILPEKLKKGDIIGIISPAGAVKEKVQLDSAVKYLESNGYKVKIAPHICDKQAYLAGNDNDRLKDLTDFFLDDEIKAILCSRGGYGTFRFLENIDWTLIKNNPKIFVGYSDITALLNNFVEKSNMVCFHGPLAISDFGADNINAYTEENFWKILEGKIQIPYSFDNPINYECITKGQAEGILMGGNLSILCGLLGTPYFPDLTNKILLLEDISEPLYKIDRMLAQLKLAGVFGRVAGILFADFTSIPESKHDLTALNIAKDFTKDLNIPVGYGFAASHATPKATLPFGIKYFFDSENFKLEIRENYIK